MRMYPSHNLFTQYLTSQKAVPYSIDLPDRAKRFTLERMNIAINFCEKWDHAMDIGGGNGHYLAALTSRFKTNTLVEVDEFPEHGGLATAYPNLHIERTYVEQYQSETKADFIMLIDLFEHIPDIGPFVRQVSLLQSIGGVLYILTPNPAYCGPAPESGIYHTRQPHGHIKHYPQSEIISHLAAVGYELQMSWYEEGLVRQKCKRIIFGLIRRNKIWQNYFWYSLIKTPFIIIGTLVGKVLGVVAYHSERAHAQDPFTTMTQDLVFKKVRDV